MQARTVKNTLGVKLLIALLAITLVFTMMPLCPVFAADGDSADGKVLVKGNVLTQEKTVSEESLQSILKGGIEFQGINKKGNIGSSPTLVQSGVYFDELIDFIGLKEGAKIEKFIITTNKIDDGSSATEETTMKADWLLTEPKDDLNNGKAMLAFKWAEGDKTSTGTRIFLGAFNDGEMAVAGSGTYAGHVANKPYWIDTLTSIEVVGTVPEPPTDPTESNDPTNPADSTDPTNPTNPADPTQEVTPPATEPNPAPVVRKGHSPLLVRALVKGDNAIGFKWAMKKDADGYEIYFSRCDKKDKVFKPKKVKTIKDAQTTKWTKKGLRAHTPYKAYIKAYVMKNGKKKYVYSSPWVHVLTSGGNKFCTNPKEVTVDKKDVTIETGKTFKIKANVIKRNPNKKLLGKAHAPKLRYYTSNKKIATVTKGGKIKGKSQGKCKIYAVAVNGMKKTVNVTVQ